LLRRGPREQRSSHDVGRTSPASRAECHGAQRRLSAGMRISRRSTPVTATVGTRPVPPAQDPGAGCGPVSRLALAGTRFWSALRPARRQPPDPIDRGRPGLLMARESSGPAAGRSEPCWRVPSRPIRTARSLASSRCSHPRSAPSRRPERRESRRRAARASGEAAASCHSPGHTGKPTRRRRRCCHSRCRRTSDARHLRRGPAHPQGRPPRRCGSTWDRRRLGPWTLAGMGTRFPIANSSSGARRQCTRFGSRTRPGSRRRGSRIWRVPKGQRSTRSRGGAGREATDPGRRPTPQARARPVQPT